MKIILRIQGAKGSRIQVKGMEVKPLNPEIFEPYFLTKESCKVKMTETGRNFFNALPATAATWAGEG